MSQGRDSFHVCDVCGFRYNVRRAAWAGALESDALLHFASLSLLLACIALAGAMCQWVRLPVALWFYGTVEWRPPWHDAAAHRLWRASATRGALDALVAGAVLCGAAGTASAAYATWCSDRMFFYSRVLPSVATAFASSGTPVLRAFVIGGIYVGALTLGRQLRTAAKTVLTRFGERVLEVDAAEAAQEPRVRRDLTE